MNRQRTLRIRSSSKRLTAVVLFLGLSLGLGACGVPIDSGAHRVTLGGQQVLVPAAASSNSPDGTPTHFKLYFVHGDKLAAVERPGLAYTSIETTANELLLDLDNGPLTTEEPDLVTLLNSNPGLTCTFNPQTHIITVKLDLQFVSTLFGPPLYDAYGQMVLTLMQAPLFSTVQAVNFTSNGALTYAYLPTETATASPVTSASYKSLIETNTK